MLRKGKQSRRPRVLFVGAFPPPGREVFGGMVTSCRSLLQSSFRERVELDLLDSTQASHPPPALLVRSILALRRFVVYLVRFERARPDVVLLFAARGASLVEKGSMAWYARMRGVPALMFPRSGGIMDDCRTSRFSRAWVKIAFRGARKLLCQGPAWRAFAVDVLGREPVDAPMILNWTATPDLLAIGRARCPVAEDRPVRLLFLGWLDREKGVIDLLDACLAIAPTRRFTLQLVGEGNASATAEEFITRHGLGDRMRLHGWLGRAEVHQALAAADVLVLPSWAEGLPNAMIEAMAARLAIVVSAVGNIPDVVTDGREALLVPPRDPVALAGALARIIDDGALRQSIADAAFAKAESAFGVERAATTLEATIRETVGLESDGIASRSK